MIDLKYPLRSAYYSLLNGNLTYNAVGVPVSDTIVKLGTSTNIYVLLSSELGTTDNTHQSFMSWERLSVTIVARGTRVSESILDNIAGQIDTLLLPSPQQNGLPSILGISVINLYKLDDRPGQYTADGGLNYVKRIMTYNQLVTPYANGTIPLPAGVSGFVWNEVPFGLTNGTNITFTLSKPLSLGTSRLYINGLKQSINIHYIETAPNIITITDPPEAGDTIQIDYLYI